MALTNTVQVPLPAGFDLLTVRTALESFGEIVHASMVASSGFAVVVFFDVRHAAKALEAMAPIGVVPGPQTGSRTVELDGSAEVKKEDCHCISGFTRSQVSVGAYTLEFFDIRDAKRYREANAASLEVSSLAEAPPGHQAKELAPKAQKGAKAKMASQSNKIEAMAPPPGLPFPPGLEANLSSVEETSTTASTPPMHPAASPLMLSMPWQVVITGLPNKLLAQAMVEAMLQQAGLDSLYAGLTIKTGKPLNKVSVNFATPMAAQRCVAHFHGRQWDNSGPAVCAKIVPPAPPHQNSTTAAKLGLSANAPVFAPIFGALSAQAAEFIPSAPLSAPRAPKSLISGSDTSTDVGESEDEKGSSPRGVATA